MKLNEVRSQLRAGTGAERARLNRELERTPRACALGPRFAAAGWNICLGRATEWHELRKRSAAGSTTNPDNVVPACRACNRLVETEPALAHRLGLVTRSGDDGWEAASVRHDRQENR